MTDSSTSPGPRSERVIFTLPKPLAAELEKYARIVRGGNRSGFVADAIRAYIDHFRRRRHTARLRDAYAAAAADSRTVSRDWEAIDDETWARLGQLAEPKKTS